MSEDYLLEVPVYLLGGWLAFRYTEKFLSLKTENKSKTLAFWLGLYVVGHVLWGQVAEHFLPELQQSLYGSMVNLMVGALLMWGLQWIFFEQDLPRRVFVLASFWAGWGILRFAVSPLAHVLFDWWNPLWQYLVEESLAQGLLSAEWLLAHMEAVNRGAVFMLLFFCRFVQLGILAAYLHLIGRNFLAKDYELQGQESFFLLMPCLTALVIDLTLRLMAFSVDNSALMLIYDRAPEILLLLPLVSLLLLGMVIASVILLRGLVQFKEEEQKRLLLEKGMADVHGQVRELEDIYGDIRGLRHDLRGHIESLHAYVNSHLSGEGRELEQYLAGMTKTVARLDFADKTGHAITDIILHQAKQQAGKRGIDFATDFHYPKAGDFDVYDISVILNNALQNALEACGQVASGTVEVRSYQRGGLYFLEVTNDFAGALQWEQGAEFPATSKQDKKRHGLGLANIARCAEKYQGTVDIEIKEESGRPQFCLTVMLYQRNS